MSIIRAAGGCTFSLNPGSHCRLRRGGPKQSGRELTRSGTIGEVLTLGAPHILRPQAGRVTRNDQL